VDVVHVVGGGVRNTLLCQLTASATGRTVLAGPVEATAYGNVMVQAHAGGYVGSLDDIRTVVRRSTEVQTYEPEGSRESWATAYERLLTIIETHGRVAAMPEREGG
jgi:rhamnulokinase